MTLQQIQKNLKVPKSNTNSFGKYKYRSCEDILEMVKPLLGDSLLTLSDEMINLGDRYYVKATAEFTTFEGDEMKEIFVATAYAKEPESQAGMSASQLTGTASSYARKYALNGLFLIDDTKDADTDEYSAKAPQNGTESLTQDISEVYDNLQNQAEDLTNGFNRALSNDRV